MNEKIREAIKAIKEKLGFDLEPAVEINSWCGDTESVFYTEYDIDMDALNVEIDRFQAELAARATPAQPVPVAKYAEEMKQMAEIHRIELQRMFDAPANPCEAAFKEKTLSQGSQPKEWDDTAPVMVWYGYCEFKKGYDASQPSPSSVGAAILALSLPEPVETKNAGYKCDPIKRYDEQQMRALLSEAAALAEQHRSEDTILLDWFDQQRTAYGFEGLQEGNEWLMNGPFATLRQALRECMSAAQQSKGGQDG